MIDGIVMIEDITAVRGTLFLVILGSLLGLQQIWPRKRLTQKRAARWVPNFGIFIAGGFVTKALAIIAGLATSLYAEKIGWGLFNRLDLPVWAAFTLSVVALDFAVWFQHVLSHHWGWLWRLHRVHHTDMDIDVTTALRFHPVEIGVSLLYKSAVIFLLGVPILAVAMFDIILNGLAMFNHANLALPKPVDKILRRLIVTPDMHRVHHSVRMDETQSNYGFCLSVWDRLFGVYTDQPKDGHDHMEIGLADFREIKYLRFWPLLVQPLKSEEQEAEK